MSRMIRLLSSYLVRRRGTREIVLVDRKNGQPQYWDSVWGKMLQNVDLQITGSTVQKVFMRGNLGFHIKNFRNLLNGLEDGMRRILPIPLGVEGALRS